MSDNSILEKKVLENIKEQYDCIFSAEKKVADFILQNPQKAVESNVSELARLSGVSDAMVVRMCHHVGYTGYCQFRIALARDLGKQQFSGIAMPESEDAVVKVFTGYAETMLAIGRRLDKDVMKHCVNLLKGCKQAHIMATGNTSPRPSTWASGLGGLE